MSKTNKETSKKSKVKKGSKKNVDQPKEKKLGEKARRALAWQERIEQRKKNRLGQNVVENEVEEAKPESKPEQKTAKKQEEAKVDTPQTDPKEEASETVVVPEFTSPTIRSINIKLRNENKRLKKCLMIEQKMLRKETINADQKKAYEKKATLEKSVTVLEELKETIIGIETEAQKEREEKRKQEEAEREAEKLKLIEEIKAENVKDFRTLFTLFHVVNYFDLSADGQKVRGALKENGLQHIDYDLDVLNSFRNLMTGVRNGNPNTDDFNTMLDDSLNHAKNFLAASNDEAITGVSYLKVFNKVQEVVQTYQVVKAEEQKEKERLEREAAEEEARKKKEEEEAEAQRLAEEEKEKAAQEAATESTELDADDAGEEGEEGGEEETADQEANPQKTDKQAPEVETKGKGDQPKQAKNNPGRPGRYRRGNRNFRGSKGFKRGGSQGRSRGGKSPRGQGSPRGKARRGQRGGSTRGGSSRGGSGRGGSSRGKTRRSRGNRFVKRTNNRGGRQDFKQNQDK